jgi:hypothetical protein
MPSKRSPRTTASATAGMPVPSSLDPVPPAVASPSNSSNPFARATKHQAKLRLTLDGPSGSGKTYSALAIGTALGGRIALIDTEHGSASKYAGDPFTFDTLKLDSFEPRRYVKAIKDAEAAGYDVLVIDSLSHAWAGKGGALEQVDQRAGAKGNKFAAWRDVTPMQNELIDAIIGARLHVIATMRTKTEYAVDQDNGKTTVRKLGLAPVQRDGVEYEFDLVGDLDLNHNLHITKTRCKALDDVVIAKPGAQLAATLKAWLDDGTPEPPHANPVEKEGKPRREQTTSVVAEQGSGDGRDNPAAPAIFLTHEQKTMLVHLGNTLDNGYAPSQYARDLAELGSFLAVRDKLIGLHREQHGVLDQHFAEAVMAAGTTG